MVHPSVDMVLLFIDTIKIWLVFGLSVYDGFFGILIPYHSKSMQGPS